MFHSRGTVQSNTWVPLGTSCSSRSTCLARVARVLRKPSPVMLRQTGYSSAMSSCMAVPASAGSVAAITSLMVTYQFPPVAASRGPADPLDALPVGPAPVALRHHPHLGGPVDPERRVVVAQAPGRVRTQVDDHVVDRSVAAADQLGLLVRRRLPVHAPHGAPVPVQRDVALHRGGVEAVLGELPGAEGAREQAALVGVRLRVDHERVRKSGLGEDHLDVPPLGLAAGGSGRLRGAQYAPRARATAPNVFNRM